MDTSAMHILFFFSFTYAEVEKGSWNPRVLKSNLYCTLFFDSILRLSLRVFVNS